MSIKATAARPHVPPPSPKAMVSRLMRFTPNCDYAEVEIVSHPGSHHKPGDIVLITREEYAAGRTIKPELSDEELYKHRSTPVFVDEPVPKKRVKPGLDASRQSISQFLANLPTGTQHGHHSRRKSKGPST